MKKTIGLLQLDGAMPNLSLMKLSTFYKSKGDDVVFYDLSNSNVDLWFGSKIFMGGSGYDVSSKLPSGIEEVKPDYSLYDIDYKVGFTSRGCIRNCDFCIVREKEGFFRDLDFSYEKNDKVILFDNNFFASKFCLEKLNYFIDNNIKVCFNQGLDFRLLSKNICILLSKVKAYDRFFKRRVMYFALDNVLDIWDFRSKMSLLDGFIKPSRIMVYILIDFNSTFDEDFDRFNVVNDMGFDPYIMVYNKKFRSGFIDKHKLDFQRWVNRRLYKVCSFEEYNNE